MGWVSLQGRSYRSRWVLICLLPMGNSRVHNAFDPIQLLVLARDGDKVQHHGE